MGGSAADLGLYLHIPFCVHKCFYCDFATSPHVIDAVPPFLAALKSEATTYGDRALAPVGSVFFGGGTPSLLSGEYMIDLMAHLRNEFDISDDAEMTVEANPETVAEAKLAAYREAGINRLSFGVQVFDDAALKALGRDHSVADTERAYAAARSVGFDNVNLDLIFALPDQSEGAWRASVERAVELQPEHLSIYCLTVEPKTVYDFLRRKNALSLPDEDAQARMYEWTLDAMESADYAQYEISNFARSGRECRHNLRYWRNQPHIGLGPSACGYLNGERYSNARGVKSYIKRIEEGRDPVAERERLSGKPERAETVIQALRMREGVCLAAYERRYGRSLLADFGADIDPLCDLRLLERADGALRLTRRGLLMANEVFVRLLPDD